ncbi:hypothetical protein FHL15_007330 [Xylaria flabelliformis]|uniref:Uncharacterized protein n=1 Tax=Xylaria flabelliformis TaxID=2512241 RepID=A0A553HV16_9PEZI|nr:hypothetical protein FHL15_007330 [Xylaria flabelliformis]
MSYDPISYLGLSCPSGGKFYICQGSKIEFLGCCDVDPCSSQCPLTALHPAGLDIQRYADDTPAQSCVGSTPSALWWTSTTASVSASTSTPRDESTSAPISTTTQTPSPIPTNTASKGSSSAPTAGIVGGILGGSIILILIAFVFFRYRGRRTRQFARAHSDEFTSQSTWSPYRDTFRSSPTVLPSPHSTASNRHKSLSASLSSIIGFKRWSAAKRQSFQTSDWVSGTHDGRQASPGNSCPVTELESLPPGGIIVRGPHNAIHYEVEGTAVVTGTR